MAGAPWQFTVLPNTITEVTITNGSTTVTVQRNANLKFSTSAFVETATVTISATGYTSKTATVAVTAAVDFTSYVSNITKDGVTYQLKDANATTALTTKADTDLSNVNNTGKSTGAGWAMPSSTASAVSLSTSSSHTMTSAGWVIVGAFSNNIGSVTLQIGNMIHAVCSSYTGGNAQSFNYYPVYAGELVNIATDGTGTIDLYVFVPCAGVN